VATVLLLPCWPSCGLVIAPEERYLGRRFGADYVRYTQRVAVDLGRRFPPLQEGQDGAKDCARRP